MDTNSILKMVDHTELSTVATFNDIKLLIDDAVLYNCASVCIPPDYVKQATEYANGKMPICTVIGFPNGYQSTATKLFETKEALDNGAQEIDMVINVGRLKAGDYNGVYQEIKALKNACKDKVLKVIVEACLLTEEEKIECCKMVTESGADFIKTSTGFSKGGATLEDVKLFKKYIGPSVQIKAAGGIRDFESAQAFINAGATRLGSSALVKIAKRG